MRKLMLFAAGIVLLITAAAFENRPAHAFGNCWGQFSACSDACDPSDSACQLSCECTYCVCARLLCPLECGGGGL